MVPGGLRIPTNERQKTSKLVVVVVALPEIDEAADHLKIAFLVVTHAVDAIERWRRLKVGVVAGNWKGISRSSIDRIVPRRLGPTASFRLASSKW
jgi:hypothetical protein